MLISSLLFFCLFALELFQRFVFFELIVLVGLANEAFNFHGELVDDALLFFRFLFLGLNLGLLLFNLQLKVFDSVDFVGSHADCRLHHLGLLPDFFDLSLAVLDVCVLILVRSDQGLVKSLVLLVELLE